MSKKRKGQIIMVRVTDAEKTELARVAEACELDMSEIVRQAVRRYLPMLEAKRETDLSRLKARAAVVSAELAD